MMSAASGDTVPWPGGVTPRVRTKARTATMVRFIQGPIDFGGASGYLHAQHTTVNGCVQVPTCRVVKNGRPGGLVPRHLATRGRGGRRGAPPRGHNLPGQHDQGAAGGGRTPRGG